MEVEGYTKFNEAVMTYTPASLIVYTCSLLFVTVRVRFAVDEPIYVGSSPITVIVADMPVKKSVP
jgi:hypothetical protein